MSGTGSEISKGFRDVDSQPRPQDFTAYLRRVRELMSAEKAQSYGLLEPSPGKRLLDVGCGSGDDVRAMARLVAPTGQSVGVDISRSMIDDARRGREPRTSFFVADAHALPFADSTFDGARIERTLQHVEHPAIVLGEMIRVVRPGGIVAASEPDWGTLAVDASHQETTREVVRVLCDRHIRNGWMGRQLCGLFVGLGLRNIDIWPVPFTLRSFVLASDLLLLKEAGTREWLAELEDRDARGQFFASITGFTVKGRRARIAEN